MKNTTTMGCNGRKTNKQTNKPEGSSAALPASLLGNIK
jgi:hypothetical protein